MPSIAVDHIHEPFLGQEHVIGPSTVEALRRFGHPVGDLLWCVRILNIDHAEPEGEPSDGNLAAVHLLGWLMAA